MGAADDVVLLEPRIFDPSQDAQTLELGARVKDVVDDSLCRKSTSQSFCAKAQ